MKAKKLADVMKTKPAWSHDGATFWQMEKFNGGQSWLGQFSGQSPWEMHPDADELIYVLEGKVEMTILMGSKKTRSTVSKGSVFIVPKGKWHRQTAKGKGKVKEFGATSGRSKYSYADDPRKTTKGSHE